MNFFIIAGILAVWLLALTVFVILQTRFFNKLTRDAKGRDLKKVLKDILKQKEKNEDEIKGLEKELKKLSKEGELHVQKIGLIRFNPFKELGGDHSFSVAILDGEETGFIVTGLHTRERTRVYAKEIKNGESEIELSEEEKKALNKAKKS